MSLIDMPLRLNVFSKKAPTVSNAVSVLSFFIKYTHLESPATHIITSAKASLIFARQNMKSVPHRHFQFYQSRMLHTSFIFLKAGTPVSKPFISVRFYFHCKLLSWS